MSSGNASTTPSAGRPASSSRSWPSSSSASLVSSQFLTASNVFYLNLSIGEVAIMTLPMTLIIVTGEIDLSVASILGLSSALLGDLVSHGWPVPAAMAAVLVAGTTAGAFNGFLITRSGFPRSP